ncbi:MAG: ABC transporter ATP-binding protein/permease [Clostridia bacterium]|jgi:ATP-binding cassette subfamily B protein|nr:ABC transporter ATP-binding protein/permease [Clostridia bacterium]
MNNNTKYRSFAKKFIYPYKLKYLLLFITMIIEIGFLVAIPLIWGKAIVDITKYDIDNLKINIGILVVTKVLYLVFSYIRPYISFKIRTDLHYDLRLAIYEKMLKLEVRAYEKIKMSQFLSRINNEVAEVSRTLDKMLVAIMDVVTSITIVGVIFSKSILLGAITTFTLPILYLLFKKYGKIIKEEAIELKNKKEKFLSQVHEVILGIREVKSLGIEEYEKHKAEKLGKAVKDEAMIYRMVSVKSLVISKLINLISEVLGIIVCIYLVIINALNLEYLIAYRSYSLKLRTYMKNITSFNLDYQQLLVSVDRIMEILDNDNYHDDVYGEKCISEIDGSIEFKDVEFEYIEGVDILKDFSMNISPKSKVAVVGKSGCGKSTIFNILLKFYNIKKGKVLIGGNELEEFNEDSLRKHVSVIRQDVFLFNATIKENLRLAKSDATDEEIESACKKAVIHDYIMSLEKGYETLVDEGAETFSGGQKQRISIARAILKNSKIMLFDEATSALDNVSQKYINDVLNDIKKEHTIIVIAHRLENIKDADEIFVIDKGRVVAQGKHEELLKRNEVYKDINLEGVKA